MVKVKMGQKQFIKTSRRYAQAPEVPHCPAAHVEDEVVPIPQLHQPAGGSLSSPKRGISGATGADAHLVGRELFPTREVVFGVFPECGSLLFDDDG
jgi:hypothetical protein